MLPSVRIGHGITTMPSGINEPDEISAAMLVELWYAPNY